jgi:outer membrane protein OmpA-like peptidoglycan-associated protein
MSVKARCLNYTGCLLAYRGEIIELPSNAPLVCPECGKTVSVSSSKGGGVGKILAILAVIAAVAVGLYFLVPKLRQFISVKPTEETTEPATPAGTPPRKSPGSETPRVSLITPGPITPPAPPSTPAKIQLDVKRPENQMVRDEVLKRVDAIPNLTKVQKDKLINSVLRAKNMGLVVTIPFGSGTTKLPATEIPALKAQLDQPELRKLRDDFTCVFVILGFADPTGDEAKNLKISQSRADSVFEVMRDKCAVTNVMHPVAMGGSKLMDDKNLEKNRVVEIWAVLP